MAANSQTSSEGRNAQHPVHRILELPLLDEPAELSNEALPATYDRLGRCSRLPGSIYAMFLSTRYVPRSTIPYPGKCMEMIRMISIRPTQQERGSTISDRHEGSSKRLVMMQREFDTGRDLVRREPCGPQLGGLISRFATNDKTRGQSCGY